MSEVLALGAVTEDLVPIPHMGGGAAYSAVVFSRLGIRASVVTKLPEHSEYLDELSGLGVHVCNLPVRDPGFVNKITTFENYNVGDQRRQVVTERAEEIGPEDLANFPTTGPKPTYFVATVIGEVGVKLFESLSEKGNLVVTPQGYFREITDSGEVRQRPWKNLDSLKYAELTILSDEDITFEKSIDEYYLEQIKKLCRVVIITRGSAGLSIYEQDKPAIEIKTLPISSEEVVSPTGAGDTCAAALTWSYLSGDELRTAGTFGAMYAALKLMGISKSKRGVEAIPAVHEIQAYVSSNKTRMDEFFGSNEVTPDTIADILDRAANKDKR